jgi:hypothetical protein
MKVSLILIMLGSLVVTACWAYGEPATIRAIHIQWSINQPFPNELLQRAQKAGYNYLVSEYWISQDIFKSDWQSYKNSRHSNVLQHRLTQHFIQADSFGLKLIPEFNAFSRWARWLKTADFEIDSQIIPIAAEDRDSTVKYFWVPAFSPDEPHLKRVLNSLLQIVNASFLSAKPQLHYKYLEFICFGYEEIYSYGWLPKANKSDINKPAYIVLAGLNKSDTEWLKKKKLTNKSSEEQIQYLIAASIKSTAKMVSTKWNSKTRLMVFGNLFDPGAFGNYTRQYSLKSLCGYNFKECSLNVNFDSDLVPIKTTGILYKKDMLSVKNSIVIIPWMYDTIWNQQAYNPQNILDTLATMGFQYAFGSAGAELNGCALIQNDQRYLAAGRWFKASQKPSCNKAYLGYVCFNWVNLGSIYLENKWCGESISKDNMMAFYKPFEWIETLSDICRRNP